MTDVASGHCLKVLSKGATESVTKADVASTRFLRVRLVNSETGFSLKYMRGVAAPLNGIGCGACSRKSGAASLLCRWVRTRKMSVRGGPRSRDKSGLIQREIGYIFKGEYQGAEL